MITCPWSASTLGLGKEEISLVKLRRIGIGAPLLRFHFGEKKEAAARILCDTCVEGPVPETLREPLRRESLYQGDIASHTPALLSRKD